MAIQRRVFQYIFEYYLPSLHTGSVRRIFTRATGVILPVIQCDFLPLLFI